MDAVEILLRKITQVTNGLPCHTDGSPSSLQFHRKFGFDADIQALDEQGVDISAAYRALVQKGLLAVGMNESAGEIEYRLRLTDKGRAYLQNVDSRLLRDAV